MSVMKYYFYIGLLLVFSSLPMCVLADVDVVIGIEWTYTVHNGEAWIGTGIEGETAIPITTAGMIAIPETLGGCPVTRIEDYAFYWCDKISDVTIPDTVKDIGFRAFSRCGGIRQGLTIPNSVTNIADQAFWMCQGLSSVKIPSNVDRIGESAFDGCTSMTHAEIAARHIANYAFSGCGLYSVSMRDGVVDIECGAFSYCVSLTYLEIPISVTRIDPFNSLTWCDKLKEVYVTKGDANRVKALLAPCCAASGISIYNINFDERDDVVVYEAGFLGTGGTVRSTKTQRADLILKGVTFTRPGYSQVGWSKTEGGDLEYHLESVYSRDESVILYPVWMADKYEVLYDLDGGSFGAEHPTSAVFDSVFRVSAPVRDGYVFDGWTVSSGLDEGVALWGRDVSLMQLIGGPHVLCGNGQSDVFFENLTAIENGSVLLTANWHADSFVINDGVLVKYTGNDLCVQIPNVVTSIGDRAFYGCRGLITVTIPRSVTAIGHEAFRNCETLTNIMLPSGVTDIGDAAFYDCYGLTNVVIQEGVTNIGQCAFWGCKKLMSIRIPDSVRTIGWVAFWGCQSLQLISVDSKNQYFCSEEGVLYDKAKKELICCPGGVVTNEIEVAVSVEKISYYGFYECANLERIVLPPKLKNIEGATFKGCYRLNDIEIPNGVTNIEWDAFCECTSLKTVIIPEGVAGIGENAFSECLNLMSVTIPASMTTIGKKAFDGCTSLTVVYVSPGDTERVAALYSFDPSVKFTDVEASDGTSKDSVRVSWLDAAGATSYALYRSTMDSCPSAAICDDVKSPFEDTTAEPGVKYYYWVKVFNSSGSVICACDEGYRAVSLALDKSTVAYVADGGNGSVFVSANTSWSAISDVDWITLGTEFGGGNGTLSYMVSANATKSSRSGAITVTVGKDTYYPVSMTVVVTQDKKSDFEIVDGVLVKYEGAGGEVAIPSGVTRIGESAFSGCGDLTAVTMPPGLTYIGDYAFSNCRRLKSVIIPSSVTSIGVQAFYNCSGLESVSIPSSVISVGGEAFYGCSGLKDRDGFIVVQSVLYGYCGKAENVKIPNGVTSIGDYAFCGFHGIKSIMISDGVVNIGANAFAWCDGLVSLTIPASMTSIGEAAFLSCSGLTSMTIPTGVTNIGRNAFYSCTGLTSVTIPASLKTIGDGVFGGCRGLTSLEIPEGVECVGDNAFYDCSGLESVTIPLSVTNVSSSAFSRCSGIRTIVTSILGQNIFPAAWKKICEAVILDGVTSIEEYTFMYCSALRSITIPSSVTSIGNSAFRECVNLSSLVLPEGVMDIGEYAFLRCYELESVIIPSTVTSIGAWAFEDCNALTSVVISTGVTEIGIRAFAGCSMLKSVVIPQSVMSIGAYAFTSCTALETIYVAEGDSARVKGLYAWPQTVRFEEVVAPMVLGDESAIVSGDPISGFFIRPSEGKTAVEVTIPQGVDAAKVTVEVSPKVTSVKPKGAKVKVVSGGADITEFLNVPAADGNGVVDLTKATVKEEIVKEAMDVEKGAKIELDAANPTLITPNTRVGLFYQLREGTTLEGMSNGDSTIGDGNSWKPEIKVKGGSSAFYSIGVGKGE